MGYREDVRFTTTKEAFEFLKDAIEKRSEELGVDKRFILEKKTKEDDPYCYKLDYFEERANGIIFGFDCYKWYKSYDVIKAFENAWEDLDAAGYPWTRARIGDDPGDNEDWCGNEGWEADIPHVEVQIRREFYLY